MLTIALTFVAAVFFLIITPGPGVLSTAGVGAGFGYRAGLPYVAGLCLGTNLVALAVISGFAALVLTLPWLRWALIIASTTYLVYLAARIAFSGNKIAFIEAQAPPPLAAGMTLNVINPKAYAVNTTLFSGFPIAPDHLILEAGLKLVIINAIWIPIHLGWLWAGASLHRLDLSDHAQKRINYLMAAAMLCVVALALFSAQENS